MSKSEEGMKALAERYDKSEADGSSEKVYRLPGDNTWEYLVKDGQWMTRKIGSQSLIPIMSLSKSSKSEALQKLNPLLGEDISMRFVSPTEQKIPIPIPDVEKRPVPIPDLIEMDDELTENEKTLLRAFARDASSKPIRGGFERSEGDEKVFTLFDSSDPYEYLVVDGDWVTRKKGGESILPLSGLPLDKQLEAITKLDSNFQEARTGNEKLKSIESISNMILELPEGDSMAKRVAAMSRN